MSILEDLEPDEHIIEGGQARHLKTNVTGMGFNPFGGLFLLTNKYITFQVRGRRVIYTIRYPLKRITAAEQITIKAGILGRYNPVRIRFDNGGVEYFDIRGEDDIDWAAAILEAAQTAPDLPFTTVPSARTAVEGANPRRTVLMVAIALWALALAACCLWVIIGASLENAA